MNTLLLIKALGLIALTLWLGFVLAISFMESWLKFRAPGINLTLGLGIGRIVFHALNKVEWFFGLSIATMGILSPYAFPVESKLLFIVIITILMLQTFWLLPTLDQRIERRIQNKPVPKSNAHFLYIGLEMLKTVALLISTLIVLRTMID